jgi:hypothetical protein
LIKIISLPKSFVERRGDLFKFVLKGYEISTLFASFEVLLKITHKVLSLAILFDSFVKTLEFFVSGGFAFTQDGLV